MRILLVSMATPYLPCHDGLRARVAQLVRTLAERHPVGVVAASGPGETPAQRQWSSPFCEWVETVPAGRFMHPLTGAPGEGLDELRAAVLRAVERFKPDVLHLEGSLLAPLARAGGVPTVLAIHESRALRAGELRGLVATPWARLDAWLTERRERIWERRWFGAVDARVAPSDEDRAAIDAVSPGPPTAVIPIGVDVQHHEFRRAAQPGRLLFTGDLGWRPNVEAARHFATVLFPRVRVRWPRAELLIAGGDAVPAVRALGVLPGVRVVGTLTDFRPTIWSAAACVSPLGVGFGMKTRILEAMALGTPVAASSPSLSGIAGIVDGEHALVADHDDAMVEAVLALLGDTEIADRVARGARRLVEQRYQWPAVARQYEAWLARAARIEAAA